LFEKTSDAVFLIGLERRFVMVNRNAASLLGYEQEELHGMSIEEVILPIEKGEALARLDESHTQDVLPPARRTFVTKEGRHIILDLNLTLVRDDKGNALHYHSVARNVTHQTEEEMRLKNTLAGLAVRASTDPLTGIFNRQMILEHAMAEYERSAREGRPLSLILLDMDNLKAINDKLGHAAGDSALQQIAQVLNTSKRKYDWAGRHGGDEFLLVLPGADNMAAAEVAERLLEELRNCTIRVNSHKPMPLSASLGIASLEVEDQGKFSLEDLISFADKALYQAKFSGRNQFSASP
jgi:diguanylate cyclase (GGDEF)-like protein/PAS domain S-box-containing protein